MKSADIIKALVDGVRQAAADGDYQRRRAEHLATVTVKHEAELADLRRQVTTLRADKERAADGWKDWRSAVGDGWHPLKVGAVFMLKGEVRKLRDSGDATARQLVIQCASEFVGERLGPIADREWVRGVASIDPIPF